MSDEFILDEVKACCEKHLAQLVQESPCHLPVILEYSDKYSAHQLKKYCLWFQKRHLHDSIQDK